jgi:integrase
MAKKSLQEQLEQANKRLREQNIGVTLNQRGRRLYLRATLPPKPGSNKTNWHQQEIALGFYANSLAIKQAEASARKVGALIVLKEFDWSPYLRREAVVLAQIIEDLKKNYEKDYFASHGDTPTSRSSWKSNIERYLNLLPADKPLTKELVLQCINNTKAKTAKREKICVVLKAFVKFAGVEMDIDFKKLSKGYSPAPRNLPDDELICEWFDKIPAPEWQAVYGFLAVYGLRPHEIFHLDLTDFRSGADFVRVKKETKTGARLAFPLEVEWVDKFNLRSLVLPEIETEGKANRQLGQKVSAAFRRCKIPFHPYDLRHSWARRSIGQLDPRTAANSMGHSLETHNRIYNAWFTEKDGEKAFERYKNNPNRRRPPNTEV